jgi:hypothetical protein
MIPWKVINSSLGDLNTTDNEREMFWHIHLSENETGQYELLLPKADNNLSISHYRVDLE